MKKILFSISILSAFLICSCSSEPQKQMKDSAGKIIENSGPIYKTTECKDNADREVMRKCGDVQLAQWLEQEVIAAHGNSEKPLASKLVIEFDVLTNGKADAIVISRGISEAIDEAAISFIKKSRWHPAVHGGEEQKIHKRIPLTFKF